MMSLADRIEALTSPCRETDAAVFIALRPTWRAEIIAHKDLIGVLRRTVGHHVTVEYDFPAYTASVDQALLLIPEGWTAWELRSRQAKTEFVAEITRLVGSEQEYAMGHAATPAIALTAAAIRAREGEA